MQEDLKNNKTFDNFIITDQNEEIVIYPLMNYSLDNRNYLFYTKKLSDFNIDDVYVGEIIDDSLIPVEEDLDKFKNIYLNTFNNLEKLI